jgi:hypothetical protein
MLDKDTKMNEWQYTNQFFEEGKTHFLASGSVKDCPYNYLSVEQDDEKKVQAEHYRQTEWLGGFQYGWKESLEKNKKTA